MRRESVCVLSVAAAVISCFFVAPDSGYIDYFDFRTLALLYALMAVVAGLSRAGLFTRLARLLCVKARSVRAAAIISVFLCFFCSMLITNDVALLTFVPFTAALFELAGARGWLLRTVVLQTVAANLGSMLTPVGNPQNLYLYSYYGYSFVGFLKETFAVWLISGALLLTACFMLPKKKLESPTAPREPLDFRAIALYFALFFVCMLTVTRVLPWQIMLAVILAVLLVFDRRAVLRADFILLLTFAAFFVFSGNLSRIPAVSGALGALMEKQAFFTALGASQVISNVPAALLLSPFTENGGALLLGVNIGGLGTPVASLASLIGIKLYGRQVGARPLRFILEFEVLNILMLGLLILFYKLFN